MGSVSRVLTFSDRDAIVDVLQTRSNIWGDPRAKLDMEAATKMCRSRSMHQKCVWFGLFEDDALDVWVMIKPFEYQGERVFTHDLVCTRKRPDRVKLPNGYDLNVSRLYNFVFDWTESRGYRSYYSVHSMDYRRQYHNELSRIGRYVDQDVEQLEPDCQPSDPVLREHVYDNVKPIPLMLRRMTLDESRPIPDPV